MDIRLLYESSLENLTLESIKYDSNVDFAKIREIEDNSYPEFMKASNVLGIEFNNFSDVMEYANSDSDDEISPDQVKIFQDDKWYMILIEDPKEKTVEIVDLAGEFDGMSLFFILKRILKNYVGWVISADVKFDTSKKLIDSASKMHKIKIIHQNDWQWYPDREEIRDANNELVILNNELKVTTEKEVIDKLNKKIRFATQGLRPVTMTNVQFRLEE